MIVELKKEFTFEAAHSLPNVPEGHKCRRLHGHSYTIEVACKGEVGDESGWLIDFGDIKEAWKPVHAQLDHYYLNEIEGLENPTSEILSGWIWKRLAPTLEHLSAITVRETCTSACTYRGE